MKKLCVLHFQPVEKYPPTFNFLRLLASKDKREFEIHLITTDPGTDKQKIKISNIHIHRVAKWYPNMNRTSRMILHIQFAALALLKLLRIKPLSLLYYETLSSGAPFFYKSWFNPLCRLFIHYHEYTSPKEYASGMIVSSWLHRLEYKLYKKASWVSHTNEDRMTLFKADLGINAPGNTYVLPNHPPATWASTFSDNLNVSDRIGFVYVGALSSATTYVREIALYIAARPNECYLDIYSDNHTPEVIEFIENIKATNISFKGAVVYDDLPAILSNYQVGLVLYKGHIPNYVYNVPNKYFEYYVCSLDVWFPKEMVSCLDLMTQNTFPKVIPIDFKNLDKVSLHANTERTGFVYYKEQYMCEKTYLPLVRSLVNEIDVI